MPSTTRWALPYPASTDPPAGHTEIQALATALDGVGMDDQGTLANRPVSTSGSPGKKGRYYMVKGDATAANNGILWRDNGTGWDAIVKPMITARVTNSADQTIVSSTLTVLSFDTEIFDDNDIHSVVTNPSRFTLPPGTYMIGVNAEWSNNATGVRQIGIREGGTIILADNVVPAAGGSDVTTQGVVTLERLASTGYIEIVAFQDSGSSLRVASASESPFFWIAQVA